VSWVYVFVLLWRRGQPRCHPGFLLNETINKSRILVREHGRRNSLASLRQCGRLPPYLLDIVRLTLTTARNKIVRRLLGRGGENRSAAFRTIRQKTRHGPAKSRTTVRRNSPKRRDPPKPWSRKPSTEARAYAKKVDAVRKPANDHHHQYQWPCP